MYRFDTSVRYSEYTRAHPGPHDSPHTDKPSTAVQEGDTMRSRSTVLDIAILGLLKESPLHGYELRKQLNLLLGMFRAFSYGSLYPALKSLEKRGLISSQGSQQTPPHALAGKRARIVYHITNDGTDHLTQSLATAGPSAWDDDNFDVRFAFFGQTDADTRLRILEGRKSRLTERLETVRESNTRTRGRLDEYTLELQRYGLEQVEREVRWLEGLITHERNRPRHQADSSPKDSPATGSDV